MSAIKNIWFKSLLPVTIIASSLILFFLSQYSYLLFHALAELVTVVIAFGIFVVAWSSRNYIDNKFLMILGVGYFFVGGFDIIHTLSYRGMDVIPGATTDLPTQFWIIASFLEAGTFLIALLFLKDRPKNEEEKSHDKEFQLTFLIYSAVSLFFLLSVTYWKFFPSAYVDGVGLTTFKKASDYVIALIFLVSVVILFKKNKLLDHKMVNLLSLSLIVKAASEITFTSYLGVYDFSNMLGHLFRYISFLLLYKAILEIGLMRPYHFLFLNLKKSQEEYRSAQSELQRRIEEHLSEAYEHLGLANRKISLLLEISEHSDGKKDKGEIIDYIVNLAKSASHAKLALLYCRQSGDRFSLVCEKDPAGNQFCHLKNISAKQTELIQRLMEEKKRVNCACKFLDAGDLSKRRDVSYLVALPLVRKNNCEGFILLGFEKRTSMETQELEFLDVFSIHASLALSRLGVIS